MNSLPLLHFFLSISLILCVNVNDLEIIIYAPVHVLSSQRITNAQHDINVRPQIMCRRDRNTYLSSEDQSAVQEAEQIPPQD